MIKCGTEDTSTGLSDTLKEIPEGEENIDLPIVGKKKWRVNNEMV